MAAYIAICFCSCYICYIAVLFCVTLCYLVLSLMSVPVLFLAAATDANPYVSCHPTVLRIMINHDDDDDECVDGDGRAG